MPPGVWKNELLPMRSQKCWNVQVIHDLLPCRTNGQQLKHFPPHHSRLCPPILTQEALRLSKRFSQLLRSFCLSGIRDISNEDQDLEFRISWTEVLKFVWSGVGGSDESLGDYSLADQKAGGEGLVGDFSYRGRSIVDADPRGEPAEGLEGPSGRVSRKLLRNRISANLL